MVTVMDFKIAKRLSKSISARRAVEADFPNIAGNCILNCIRGVLYGVDCAQNKYAAAFRARI